MLLHSVCTIFEKSIHYSFLIIHSPIIEDGYVYIDKTDLVYQLTHEGKIYFLSRPRRFGKSLLVSTLEHYFLGHKELFKGLKIDQLEKDWNVYPVFHVDFNGSNFTQAGVLEERGRTVYQGAPHGA